MLTVNNSLFYLFPQFIFTFIDNNRYFEMLSKHDTKRKYIAIQNGVRSSDSVDPNECKRHITLDIFYCFGEYEKDYYSRWHDVKEYHPAGSLKASVFNGYIWKKHEKELMGRSGSHRICFISQYRDDIIEGKSFPEIKHSIVTIC